MFLSSCKELNRSPVCKGASSDELSAERNVTSVDIPYLVSRPLSSEKERFGEALHRLLCTLLRLHKNIKKNRTESRKTYHNCL